jgi:glucoamylase
LAIKEGSTISDQVKVMIQAGDAVLYRIYQHVKSDNGHIFEQMDRISGIQKSAHDLTWSYANILSAMKEREKAAEEFTTTFKVSLE